MEILLAIIFLEVSYLVWKEWDVTTVSFEADHIEKVLKELPVPKKRPRKK
jgi:hypothetical protein